MPLEEAMRARLKPPGWGEILFSLRPLVATSLALLLGAVILLVLDLNPWETYGTLAFSARGNLFTDTAGYGVGDGPTSVVSCLGDSITNGYPYGGTDNTYPARLLVMLEATHGSGSFEVINHGVDGYRADQVLADLQGLNWMAEDPDFVLLMVGGNDLAQEVLPDLSNLFQVINQTVSEVQAIVDLVTAHANADGSHPQIIVSAFPPNRLSDSGGSAVVAFYNSSLESNLTGLDLWITDNWDDLYDPETGQARASLMFDAVHPNVDGYIVIAGNWFEAIETLLVTPTYHHFLPLILKDY
jgi:lysophospholipase L1-like esterase